MANRTSHFHLAWCLVLLLPLVAEAAKNDWAEGTRQRADGATRDCYNRAGMLKWDHYMGDWRDAEDVAQGSRPYALATVTDDDTTKPVEWDVTELVSQWLAGKYPNQGMFLRAVRGAGSLQFRSREYAEKAQRPQLVLVGNGRTVSLEPEADTYLDTSTYRSLGDGESLRVSDSSNHALLRFDLTRGTFPVRQNGEGTLETCPTTRETIDKATLRLHTFVQYGNGSMDIGVFRCRQGHDLPPSDPVMGLAAQYPGDQDILGDPDVLFFADFESEDWADAWSYAGGNLQPVAADPQRGFQPFRGKALRVKMAEGTNTAMNVTFKLRRVLAEEPEEIYFRYYLRLGSDWNQTVEGGKMPGISGTYGVAGWGGRRSDGTNGWSARGAFFRSVPQGNPLAGTHPIGTYCYHADQSGPYGETWVWQNDYRGFLETGRWYAVEQYLKLNTPGEKDGVLRAWVDGRLAFEKTDIRFRHVDKLRIEQIWMNVYHGGTKPSPYDQHLFVDNVVIARKYIGPMRGGVKNDE